MTTRLAPTGRVLLAFGLFLFSSLPALAQRVGVTKIISQADAPVEIKEYKARYEAASNSTTYSRGNPDQVAHDVAYINKSGKKLAAVEFALVEFSLFNEYLGRLYGLAASDLPTQNETKPKKASWVHSPYASFAFLTAVAYVSQVRFDDGQIWKADLTDVIGELKKIESDFDSNVLKKKKADEQ